VALALRFFGQPPHIAIEAFEVVVAESQQLLETGNQLVIGGD
jgi:hypothetical protein